MTHMPTHRQIAAFSSGHHLGLRRCRQLRVSCGAETQERSVKDVKAGIRWDPSYSRWVRDDKIKGKVDAPVKVTPKVGVPYTIWPVMQMDLLEYGLQSYPPAEAAEMQKQGWTLVDVRVKATYEKGHIPGSVSIPLYRDIEGRTTMDNIKRFAMGSFAMRATERDPDFAQKVIAQLGKDTKIMVVRASDYGLVDDMGGTLSTEVVCKHKVKTYEVINPEFAFGRESRSLKAAHALLEAGCKNLAHLEGGLQQWRHQGFTMEK